MHPPRLAFVDLETTGTTPRSDRITEIGIVQVDADGMREWSSLVHPGRPIPPAIQSLTGITDAMVAGAPPFEALADDIARRLDGYLFIAHNARFDHGFLREEFDRLDRPFRPDVLCTVRLSRKLYPQYRSHSLDALIARHGLHVHARHRALDDARLLWHFWQDIHREFPAGQLGELVDALAGRVPWPEYLDPALPRLLPDSHGVYVLRDVNHQPLYVGRASRLRDKVLAHFQPGAWKSAKARRLAEQVRHIEWLETGGAIGALLHENRLLRTLAPLHNRRARTPALAGDTHWPYEGPVGIREARVIHVVERWQFLGSATDDQALYGLLDGGRAEYDHEVHRILRDRLAQVPLLRLDRARTD
ncbi:exonuclease domain-containing protein [Pigmentiphaga sp. CHJ604]|uniref:exonuclease domain-containing protein n=1 Tax=Pigmentiphaga sp. CHJ604 TaxID=3081984 RepID=UPI0030D20F48